MAVLHHPRATEPVADTPPTQRLHSAYTSLTRALGGNAWLSWAAVCAAEPILMAVVVTALFKPILATDPYAAPIRWTLFIVIAVALAAPVVLQWLALRRMAPELRFWMWLVSVLLAVAIAVSLEFNVVQLTQVDRDFARAQNLLRIDGTPLGFLALPWGRLLLLTVAVVAATQLVPAWVFALTAGLRWYAPLLAAIVGACVATAADQIYNFYDLYVDSPQQNLMLHAMNGWSWRTRLAEVCLLGGAGGVSGATSALVLALLTRRVEDAALRHSLCSTPGARGLTVMLAATLGIAVAAPIAAVALTPHKARAAYNALSKTLSFAPSNDIVEGDEILRYSHSADVRSALYSTASFSPDGDSFVTKTADARLVRIETSSGRTLGAIGEQLGRYERFALAWSVDGRFLALRTDGEEVTIARTPRAPVTRHRARFRLYSLPDHAVAGEYSHREHECFDGYADPSMLFDADGTSLWVVCAQDDYPKPQDLMAIKLEIPSMKVLELRFFGDGATSEAVDGLVRIAADVWVWQHRSRAAEEFRVRDLTNDRDVTLLRDLDQPRFADNFVAQRDRVTESRITLHYRSWSPSETTMRRLVFDTQSGALVEKTDELGSALVQYREVMETDNLRIEAAWKPSSKAGEIDVFDAVSREHRQHLVTRAQRPAGSSPAGRWVVMNAFEDAALRIYRVTP